MGRIRPHSQVDRKNVCSQSACMGVVRRLWKFLIVGLCWLSLSYGQARAAEIITLPHSSNDVPIISISGELLDGDDRKFARTAVELESALVVFNSPGGNLKAGIGIGKAIRLKEFVTAVGDSNYCASACGIAWLGGIKRLAHPNARIGFHAAYVIEGGETSESGSGNALVGAYFNQLGLRQSAIEYLTSAPPSDMQWLPLKEANSFGIDLEIMDDTAPPDLQPNKGRPQNPTSSSSLWEHNGSVMRLVTNGERRLFVYERPRDAISREGVTAGTVLFEGFRQGNSYKGKARVFSKRCSGPVEFQVSGQVIGDNTVLLEGDRQVYQDCQPSSETRHERLLFRYLSRTKEVE